MKPQQRTKALMTLLGWKGGTIHDACKEIGVGVHDFLYGTVDYDGYFHSDFYKGYEDACRYRNAKEMTGNGHNYWFGAISAVVNDFQIVRIGG